MNNCIDCSEIPICENLCHSCIIYQYWVAYYNGNLNKISKNLLQYQYEQLKKYDSTGHYVIKNHFCEISNILFNDKLNNVLND